jgi:AcrR family transcriptional regulator
LDPNTSEQRDTKTRILDAAEILFAENGYKRTSIKALACRARVNLAAVNYHFGSKHALMEKVIERRLTMINDLRMERFQQIEAEAAGSDCPPSVPALLRAFIEPVFTVTDTLKKEGSFLLIEGRAFAETDPAIREIFIRHFKPAFTRLSGLMQAALPELSAPVLRWRLHFAIGAFDHTLKVCGSRPVPGFFPPVEQPGMVVSRLVAFLAHGMTAPHTPEDRPTDP